MADISYVPTFHHTDWVDRVDRVQAAGPNGMNQRFAAIDSDLKQASTVVGQVKTAIDALGVPPPAPPPGPPTQHLLTFTPQLVSVTSPAGWAYQGNGIPVTSVSIGTGAADGVQNLNLPDGARLISLRAVGSTDGPSGAATFQASIVLARILIRLNLQQPPGTTTLASVGPSGFASGPYDNTQNVPADLAVVDNNTFRYFLNAGMQTLTNGNDMFLTFVQIAYTI
jgi:hypothetical protein